MKKYTFAVVIGVVMLAAGVVVARLATSQSKVSGPSALEGTPVQMTQVNDYKLSGPYTHQNLTVYLVHGEDTFKGKIPLTLQEAMERKVVVVHETKDVNQLAIENVSKDEVVFVQAGDIVKGGQQDRVLSTDLLISARSGRIPIDAFCVEQGRWSGRGSESVAAFGVSSGSLATKELKMAAKSARSQSKVWAEVEKAQEKLSVSTNSPVKSEISPSSLQLSLENPKVRESTDGYVKALSSVLDEKQDAIGYVFAVNGKVSSADIYSSGALFRKLWPKLLNSSAVEALTELPTYDKASASSVDAIREFMSSAEAAKPTERDVTRRTKVYTRDGERAVAFETVDMGNGAVWVHKNILAK